MYGQGNDTGESRAICYKKTGETIHRDAMPAMQQPCKSKHSSCRQQSKEQCPSQHNNAMCEMSREMALGEWEAFIKAQKLFVQDMRRACEEIGYVPETLSEIQEVWQSMSDEEADWIVMAACKGISQAEWPGTPRVETGVPERVHRLKALGNAIVPQVAEQIFRAIKQVNL